jgi:DNA repair ATPase RecN
MITPSLFYSEINDVMQSLYHEIALMKADLDNFKKKYEGKEISDALIYQINNRQSRVAKMERTYRYICTYIEAIETELRVTKAEKAQLIYNIKYDTDDVEEIKARHNALMKPPIPIGQIFSQISKNLKQNYGS